MQQPSFLNPGYSDTLTIATGVPRKEKAALCSFLGMFRGSGQGKQQKLTDLLVCFRRRMLGLRTTEYGGQLKGFGF
jgi:hypothetical protein